MKRNYILFSLLIFIFIQFSCTRKSSEITELSFEYSIDTLYFKNGLNIVENNDKIKCIDIKTINDSIFLYIKSSISDTLYKYYYGNKLQLVKKLCLPIEYSSISKYGKMQSLNVINNDSIIFMQDNCISIYNMNLKSIVFEYLLYDLDSIGWSLLSNFSQVQYNLSENRIYTELVRYDVPEIDGFSDSELHACIDVSTRKVFALPYKLPRELITGNLFLKEYFIVTQEKIISCFSTIPNVIVYDINSQKVDSVKLNPFQKEEVTEKHHIENGKYGDYDDIISKYNKSYFYSSMAYDEIKQRLIRNYFFPSKEKDKDGLMSNLRKPFGCTIYNNEFKPLGEINLDINEYPIMWYAINGEIYAVLLSGINGYLKILRIQYEI